MSMLGMIFAMVQMLLMAPPIAYMALNFTGSTPIASRTGVKREIFRYIPIFAVMIGVGLALLITVTFAIPGSL
jgi:hypothetical protein